MSASESRQKLVLAVITLFRRSASDTVSLGRLTQALELGLIDGTPRETILLVFDNSPYAYEVESIAPSRLIYEHHPENGGTRAAFIRGIQLSRALGCDWLLMLDQDTHLPCGYLRGALSDSCSQQAAILIPDVFDGDEQVSPCTESLLGAIRPCARRAHKPDTAIMSGCIFRVSHLMNLPIPPDAMWLDFLDHWICREMRKRKYQLLRTEWVLQHRLSLTHSKDIPYWRVANILRAEATYYASGGIVPRVAYPFRLLFRAVRAWLDASPHWRITLSQVIPALTATKGVETRVRPSLPDILESGDRDQSSKDGDRGAPNTSTR